MTDNNQYELYEIANARQGCSAASAVGPKNADNRTCSKSMLVPVLVIFGIVIIAMLAGIVVSIQLIEFKLQSHLLQIEEGMESLRENAKACSLDVMFVLDGSDRIAHYFRSVKDWVKDVAIQLKDENDNVQLGVIQYSYYSEDTTIDDQSHIETEVSLGHHSISYFSAKVDHAAEFDYPITPTAHALKLAIRDFKGSVNYEKDGNHQVLILVTDGKSSDHDILPETANDVRTLGIIPYCVGIETTDDTELREIATGDQNSTVRVTSLSNFYELRSLALDIHICKK